MRSLSTTVKAMTCALFILALSSLAHAQTRTWVSGVGDDLNPCSRTAPCKTFAGAISKTADKGEIDCLDPGGFGTVTRGKQVDTLQGPMGEPVMACRLTGMRCSCAASASTIQIASPSSSPRTADGC